MHVDASNFVLAPMRQSTGICRKALARERGARRP
jgi:hypothetical protein